MNKEECVNRIYNELMTERNHHFTIVCCFNSRRDMQNFIQSLLDKFIYIRKTKINLGTVSDCVSSTVENNHVYFMHDNCKFTDGIYPDLFYYQEGKYYSQIIEIFKYKSKGVKNSEIYSFE